MLHCRQAWPASWHLKNQEILLSLWGRFYFEVKLLETIWYTKTTLAAKSMRISITESPRQGSDFLFHLCHTHSRDFSKIKIHIWAFSTAPLQKRPTGLPKSADYQHSWCTGTASTAPHCCPNAVHYFYIRNSTMTWKSSVKPADFFYTDQAQVTDVNPIKSAFFPPPFFFLMQIMSYSTAQWSILKSYRLHD